MEFYREKLVKNPRKQYKCSLCLHPITGEHLYVSGKGYDFFTARDHVECNKEAHRMCLKCEYSNDCILDVGECFREARYEAELAAKTHSKALPASVSSDGHEPQGAARRNNERIRDEREM